MIDRLKYSFPQAKHYQTSVSATHASLSALMDSLQLDALVVTSQDEFITEYLPRPNNQRYALSAFDGSTGNGVFLSRDVAKRLGLTQQFVLFVDGRYHEQAETQTDPTYVILEKLPLGRAMWPAIADWLESRAELIRAVGYDGMRLSVAQRTLLTNALIDRQVQWLSLAERQIDHAIGLPGWKVDRPIFAVPESMTGRSAVENIAELGRRVAEHVGTEAARTCFLTCAADDLSYLLNSRGYHIPNASSHLGFMFVVGDKVALFLPDGCDTCPVELDTYPGLGVIRNDVLELRHFLGSAEVSHICYSAESVNCTLPDTVLEIWPDAQHVDFSPVESMRVSKTPEVLEQFRDAFVRSSAAIAETMRWAKYGVPGQHHSEYDLARAINDAYAARSAVALTFTTIAANGANSAAAHYTAASRENELTEGELVLLDSGAYYEGGFATDCTRVVLRKTDAATQAQPWQREIYTVALKACIAGLVTRFPADATGHDVDAFVRGVCRQYGHDFVHGTGHGVGIHVHEGGVRFSPGSKYGLVPHAVISVEPGIYLSGKGGVRIENIVIIHPVAGDPSLVEFENIVTVGYDWDLIDVELLSDTERDYLRDYEQLCVEQGTEVTACPLL